MNSIYSFALLPLLFIASALMRLDDGRYEFKHPDARETVLVLQMNSPLFDGFDDEERDGDIIFTGQTADKITCSVRLHKLAEDEGLRHAIDDPRNAVDYFPVVKRLRNLQSNETVTGDSTMLFMTRQFDVAEAGGMKLNEKHIFLYSNPSPRVLVVIHISKTQAFESDLVTMKAIAAGFSKKR